ncbi:unnamed protein product, partial [Rotaria socialis]
MSNLDQIIISYFTFLVPWGNETTSEGSVEFEQSTDYPDMTQYPDWEITGFPENS